VDEQSLQLRPCSPAIDGGRNAYYINRWGYNNDVWLGQPTDLAGAPRRVPAEGTIDIGAYEYAEPDNHPVLITQQPLSQSTVSLGASVAVPILLSGPATRYAWYQDGELLNDQTSATLTLTNVQPAQAGSYMLVATSTCNSVTSTAFSLSVTATKPPLSAQVIVHGSHVCVGSAMYMYAEASEGTAPYTYAWTVQGGATLSTVDNKAITPLGTAPGSVTLTVLITDAQNQTATASASLNVYAGPDPAFSGLPPSVCLDTSPLTLVPTTAGGSFSGPGIVGTRFNPAAVGVGGPYVINYYVANDLGCTSFRTEVVSVVARPAVPSLLTADGQATKHVPQYSGSVTLLASGCSSGQLTWTGPDNTSGTGHITVSTQTTGRFTYALSCQVGDCHSSSAQATVEVAAAALQLVTPVFDCATRQLTLRTTGGNGQPIEYQIPSETQGWTSNPQVAVDDKLYKKNKVKLNARQRSKTNGDYEVIKLDYSFPNCGSARQGAADEAAAVMTVRVLGNPVKGREVGVEVRGVEGQSLHLQLTDLRGQPVSEQLVDQAGLVEFQMLPTGSQPPGLLLLRVSTPTQSQTVKVLKH
jgi:hypothetical protein